MRAAGRHYHPGADGRLLSLRGGGGGGSATLVVSSWARGGSQPGTEYSHELFPRAVRFSLGGLFVMVVLLFRRVIDCSDSPWKTAERGRRATQDSDAV